MVWAVAIAVLSFSIGASALALFVLVHFSIRSPLSRSFVALQSLITYAVFYFFAVSFARTALADPAPFLIALHFVGHIFSGLFCYNYLLFFFRFTKTALSEKARRRIGLLCACLALAAFLPFLGGLEREGLLRRFSFQNSFAVLPLDVAAVLIATLIELASLKRIEDNAVRSILKADLWFKAVLLPAVVAVLALEAHDRAFWDLWKFVFCNVYFLAWNLSGLVLASHYLRYLVSGPGKAPKKVSISQALRLASTIPPSAGAGPTAASRLDDAGPELDRLREAMTRGKAYLDPDLTLPALAAMLGMPRNRLSRLVNEGLGKGFNVYVNECRVEEAKRLLAARGLEMDILSIAYESGFNSKAAFYAAFKRATGMAPTEYRAALAFPGESPSPTARLER